MTDTQGLSKLTRTIAVASIAAFVLSGPARAADPTQLVIGTFGGLWLQTLEKALAPFEAEHNVKIRFVTGSSVDNAARVIAARNRPDMDVVLGEELSFGMADAENVWEKLDPAIVKNLAVIVPAARMADDRGVGFIMQGVGLLYRTDAFEKNNWAPPTSWDDLLDKKYCHRIGISHPNVSFTHYALMMLGGGKPEDYLSGVKRLATNKDCIDTMDPSAPKTLEKVQLGDFAIGVSTSILTITLGKRGVPVRFVKPKEGAMLQFTTIAAVKNSPNPRMAQLLVNEMLSPRMQKVLVEQFNGSPVNPTVDMSADLIAAGAPDPKNLAGFLPIPTAEILKTRKQYIQEAVRTMGR